MLLRPKTSCVTRAKSCLSGRANIGSAISLDRGLIYRQRRGLHILTSITDGNQYFYMSTYIPMQTCVIGLKNSTRTNLSMIHDFYWYFIGLKIESIFY